MIERPVFLIGAERSGTTLLRLMLDYHPRLAFFEEFEFSIDRVSDDGCFPSVDDFREMMFTTYAHDRASKYDFNFDLSYAELIDSILVQKRGDKDLVGATVHRHFNRLPYIWPDARFIHITRDGRDVARSRIAMGWGGNTWTAIDTWLETEQLWDRFSSEIDESRRYEVRYENLIADCENTLRGVCEFIGVEFSEAMFDYAEHSTYSLPDPQLVYQWRGKATDEEVQWVEHKALDMLIARGYEPSGLPAITVDVAEAKRLKRVSDWKRRRFRMKRLGLPLMTADVASRYLPIPPFKRWVWKRVNEVRRKHLK